MRIVAVGQVTDRQTDRQTDRHTEKVSNVLNVPCYAAYAIAMGQIKTNNPQVTVLIYASCNVKLAHYIIGAIFPYKSNTKKIVFHWEQKKVAPLITNF